MPASSVTSGFPIFFLIIAAFIVIVTVLVVVILFRNFRRLKRAGHDPLTFQADFATRVMDSNLLSAERPLEQRLDELDALRGRGAITPEEHARARAEVLSSR